MLNTKIDCDCNGTGITNGWVSPDGDFDFDYCDCSICYAIAIDEHQTKVEIATLCATHKAEWIAEKTYND